MNSSSLQAKGVFVSRVAFNSLDCGCRGIRLAFVQMLKPPAFRCDHDAEHHPFALHQSFTPKFKVHPDLEKLKN
jgi:hypothetical protein